MQFSHECQTGGREREREGLAWILCVVLYASGPGTEQNVQWKTQILAVLCNTIRAVARSPLNAAYLACLAA
jgi:hypothetical protein